MSETPYAVSSGVCDAKESLIERGAFGWLRVPPSDPGYPDAWTYSPEEAQRQRDAVLAALLFRFER